MSRRLRTRGQKNELKIKKRDHTGYDSDGGVLVAGNDSEGMKRAVLAKYDEDISGTPQASG
jgi:U4/U6.U5 tri-snRNP-associated protein 1